jgi:uncharacterized protein YdcH (DUF465 family)
MGQLDDVKQELLRTNDAYRRLHDLHQAAEKRLSALTLRSLPSPEDEVEEKRLKLEKLALKDQMEAILREHRAGAPV